MISSVGKIIFCPVYANIQFTLKKKLEKKLFKFPQMFEKVGNLKYISNFRNLIRRFITRVKTRFESSS